MKKGFTLMELLAVIVILGVIAAIAMPITGNIIDNSKYKTAVDSVYGYIEAANAESSKSLIGNNGIVVTSTNYVFESGVTDEEISKIYYNGMQPTYVYLSYDYVTNVVVEGRFCMNNFSILYTHGTASKSDSSYCNNGSNNS